MTQSKFFLQGDLLTGFELSGHAGAGSQGNDIVCAAVSSAAYMTANTLTEVMKAAADVAEKDGLLRIRLGTTDAIRCQSVLLGFRMHLLQLQEQYPRHIQVSQSED